MGAAIGTGRSTKLRDARDQVEQLRQRLDEAEGEREKLRRQVEALQKERSERSVQEAQEKERSDRSAREAQEKERSDRSAREAPDKELSERSTGEALVRQRSTLSFPEAPPEALDRDRSEGSAREAVAGVAERREPAVAEVELPGSLNGASPVVGIALLPALVEGPVDSSSSVLEVKPSAPTLGSPPGDFQLINVPQLPPEEAILPGNLPPYIEKTCTSPGTPSIVQSSELMESQSDSIVEATATSPKAWVQTPCHAPSDVSGKMAHSMDSRTSTCTPGSQKILDPHRCHQCACDGLELFQDPSDLNNYCERCWVEFYGQPPQRAELQPLVLVEVFEIWQEANLSHIWAGQVLPGWPPPLACPAPAQPLGNESEVWSQVRVRVRRDVVGPHAREQTGIETLHIGETLVGKYCIHKFVGQGHFTKAYLAEDLANGGMVCVKRHRSLTVEALSDLMVIGQRMEEVDNGGQLFPRLLDAFYDYVCFTVESLVEGQNCLAMAQSTPSFFQELTNLRVVAQGVLFGLSRLDSAGIVHNDLKPDNLMWMGDTVVCGDATSPRSSGVPGVKIVDFGCARLDQREENGRNWSLAEGGAGHLGKWSPEMALRLPITHQGDIWGMAISLCELHCGRFVWRQETDTAEIVLAQSIGLCDLRDGIPPTLLRRSPLDVRQLYTPAPRHFPIRRNTLGQLEALRPSRWGLEQVLGEDWREAGKGELRGLLVHALVIDPAIRPSAAQLLECCRFASSRSREQAQAEKSPGQQPDGARGQAPGDAGTCSPRTCS